MMQRYTLLSILFAILVISSCKKKEDDPTVPGRSIFDTWIAKSSHTVVTSPNDPNYQQAYDTTFAAGAGPYIEFRGDSSYVGTLNFSAGLIAHGTFSTHGGLLVTTTIYSASTQTIETYRYNYSQALLVLARTYGDANFTYNQTDSLLRRP